MADDRRRQSTIDSFTVYLNCAAIVMFLLSSAVLIGAYSSHPWISPAIVHSLGGEPGNIFTATLVEALLISGLQLSSTVSYQNVPTTMDMVLFSVLQLAAFLIFYLAFAFFRTLIDSMVAMLIFTPLSILFPAICFIHTRTKYHRPRP